MVSASLRLCRRAAKVFGSKSVYPSLSDAWKAMHLRMAAEPGRGKAPGKTYQMRLRNCPTPVFVRRSTSDFLVLRDIFEDGEYEQASMFALAPRANVMDLGGNIGMSVLYFAGLSAGSRLIVVEPDSNNFDMLKRNCASLMAESRVTPVRAFVAAADGAAEIDRSDDAWGFKMAQGPARGGETVACVSIPSLLGTAGWDRIDLLKCDVEGAEQQLFADCAAWIHKVQHLIVETHPPYTPDGLFADLKRVGWNYKVVYQNPYTPSPRIFLSRV